jgi:hypothetical protein
MTCSMGHTAKLDPVIAKVLASRTILAAPALRLVPAVVKVWFIMIYFAEGSSEMADGSQEHVAGQFC